MVRGLIRVVHRQKCKEPSHKGYRERGSHARGVYITQDISRMGTVRVKKEEEAEENNVK